MSDFKKKFVHNLLENVIISEMLKEFGEDLYDKCIMDVSFGCNLHDFYLNHLQASLVTSTSLPDSEVDTLLDYRLDVLNLDLHDRVGAFSSQYDIVVAYDTFNVYLSDINWQATLENLLFYIKPGGLCIVNGTFPTITLDDSIRSRSKGVWRALIKKCNCSIITLLDNSSNYFFVNDKIMVIQKCKKLN